MTPPPAASPPAFAFLEAPLDRAEHLRDDAAVLAAHWPRARVLVLDADGNAFADGGGRLLAGTGGELGDHAAAAVFLGLVGDQAWFALPADALAPGSAMRDAPQRVGLRAAAASWPAPEATAFAQARAVLHWRSRHRHCGVCGAPLRYERAGWLGRCAPCGLEHYPRTDPAVIVAISDGERLLLGRNPGWPPRRYSTLAGFVEPGESLEQTVMREVFEESGVRVRECRYLASQPWPFPSSLMLGFAAVAEPDEPKIGDELEDARWFTFAEVDAALANARAGIEDADAALVLSPSISISRWLVEYWHAEHAARQT